MIFENSSPNTLKKSEKRKFDSVVEILEVGKNLFAA